MKIFKVILKIVLTLIIVALVFVGGFLIYAAVTTYHPDDVETITVEGEAKNELKVNDTISLMSWNVGYCGLDEDVDFFMDGGKMVRAESKEKVVANANAVAKKTNEYNPDIILYQEVDISAKRSYYVDEKVLLNDLVGKNGYMNTSAINFRAGYIPYPFPTTLGRVEGGLLSYSKYKVNEATRIQLPIPFSWPLSMVNLKRCLLVNRISISGSNKELVVVNLHLEAYDDGEGKIAQTKMLKEFIDSPLNN